MPPQAKKGKTPPQARRRKRPGPRSQGAVWLRRLVAVALALIIVGTGYAFLRGDGGGGPEAEELGLGQAIPIMRTSHLRTVEERHSPYNSNPPTSGPHTQFLARWGIHTQAIPPEIQVHNLEDGGVLVHYSCADCPELVRQLEEVVGQYREHVILAPYPNMETPIALTAWGRLDTLEGFDAERLHRFIRAYRGIDHHQR